MFEQIMCGTQILAIIISNKVAVPGVHFLTPNDFSQQLAYMHHPVGRVIAPHLHNPVPRQVHYTQEVLFIKRGKVRVDFYDDRQVYYESRVLQAGEVILLAAGGHGLEVLEELEMIEVKQGPYAGDMDKTRFEPVAAEKIVIGVAKDGEIHSGQ